MMFGYLYTVLPILSEGFYTNVIYSHSQTTAIQLTSYYEHIHLLLLLFLVYVSIYV